MQVVYKGILAMAQDALKNGTTLGPGLLLVLRTLDLGNTIVGNQLEEL